MPRSPLSAWGRLLAWPHWAWALAGLHCAIACGEFLHGLRFSIDPERSRWDWFWQTIPTADLMQRPWQSLWLDHAQPPGFSLWGWAWLKVCGAGHFPGCLQLGYVLLGAAVVGLTYKLARALSRSAGVALAAGAGMALNPALFYFECYLLYEPLVIFLLTASAWALWRALESPIRAKGFEDCRTAPRFRSFFACLPWVGFKTEANPRLGKSNPSGVPEDMGGSKGSGRWLVVYFGLLNALVLTRSLYHLIFILGALGPAWPVLRTMRWRRRLAVAALALALPAGWYAKNLAQYGFFGASSWYGFGLYKCVETEWPQKEMLGLIRQGVIPKEIAAGSVYDRKISYYRQFGYDKASPAALLGRDDFHNINVPALSKTFYATAKRLIRLNPGRYLQAMHLSYRRFCRPPSRFIHLQAHRARFIGWEPLVADWFYGQWVTDAIEIPTRFDLGSLFYFYFPVLMIGGAWWAVRRWREGQRGIENRSERLKPGREVRLKPASETNISANPPAEAGGKEEPAESRLRNSSRELRDIKPEDCCRPYGTHTVFGDAHPALKGGAESESSLRDCGRRSGEAESEASGSIWGAESESSLRDCGLRDSGARGARSESEASLRGCGMQSGEAQAVNYDYDYDYDYEHESERTDETPAPHQARAALMAYFVYACLYVAVIGNMMESGENERFRFATEPMTLIVALMGVRFIGSRLLRPAAARFRAG